MVSVAQAGFKLLGKLKVQALLLIYAPEKMGQHMHHSTCWRTSYLSHCSPGWPRIQQNLELWQVSCLRFARPGITDVSHHTHLFLTDWFCTIRAPCACCLPRTCLTGGLFESVLPTLPFPYETFFFDPKGIKYLLNAWCSFFENLEKM